MNANAVSGPHTPAFTTFCSNMERFDQLFKLTERGISGLEQEVHAVLDPVIQAGKVPPEIREILDATEDIIKAFLGVRMISEWMPVMMVTMVEAYLTDGLAYAAQHAPQLMKTAEQSAPYATLVRAASLDEVLTELRYRWANNFLEGGGPRTWVKKLTNLGARGYRSETAREMETLWGLRHLVVHTAGVVTAEFTRRHPHLGFKVGERVPLSFAYGDKWMKHITDFVGVTEDFFIKLCGL